MSTKELREREDVIAYLTKVQPEPLDINLVINSVLNATNARELDSNLVTIFDMDDPAFSDSFTESAYYAATLGARSGNPKRLKAEETDVELSNEPMLLATTAKDVKFENSVGLLENRVAVTKYYYDKLPKDLKSLSFYVSGLEKLREVELVKTSLSNAMNNGYSFEEWKNSFDTSAFKDLSKGRLETVYRNNVNTVYNQSMRYNAGTSDVTPYLQYTSVGDDVTRPSHQALNGTVKRADSNFWDKYTPPIAHNCRCGVINLTKEDAEALGISTRSVNNFPDPEPGFGDKSNKTYGDVLGPTKAASQRAINKLPANSPYRSRFQNSLDNVGQKVDIWWEGVKNIFGEQ